MVGLCDLLAVLPVLMEPVRQAPGLADGGCGSTAAHSKPCDTRNLRVIGVYVGVWFWW